MGRSQVVEITCDRCTRVEHRPLSEARKVTDPNSKDHYALRAIWQGKRVEFEDLCSACEDIVGTRFTEIAKELVKASPRRSKKDERKLPPKIPQAPKVG